MSSAFKASFLFKHKTQRQRIQGPQEQECTGEQEWRKERTECSGMLKTHQDENQGLSCNRRKSDKWQMIFYKGFFLSTKGFNKDPMEVAFFTKEEVFLSLWEKTRGQPWLMTLLTLQVGLTGTPGRLKSNPHPCTSVFTCPSHTHTRLYVHCKSRACADSGDRRRSESEKGNFIHRPASDSR